jgi:hypothetical protein
MCIAIIDACSAIPKDRVSVHETIEFAYRKARLGVSDTLMDEFAGNYT